MVGRVALACSLALVGAMLPLCTSAEPPPAAPAPALTWDAPATCLAGDLMARVAGLVGLRPEQLAGKLERVDAAVSPSASGGWVARLHIETAAGSELSGMRTRSLCPVSFSPSGTSCAMSAHMTLFFYVAAQGTVSTMRLDADNVPITGGPTGYCK